MGTGKDDRSEFAFMEGGAVHHTPPLKGGAVQHTPPAPGRPKRGNLPVKKYTKECFLIYTSVILFEEVLGFIWFSKS